MSRELQPRCPTFVPQVGEKFTSHQVEHATDCDVTVLPVSAGKPLREPVNLGDVGMNELII
jgi:hypothetical protein